MDIFNLIYQLVSGPLVWVAFFVFIGGSIFKVFQMFLLINKKEKFIYTYMSLKYSLRSIIHWIIPFATVNWRRHPVLTIITFSFHTCLLITPTFLLAHAVLWKNAWDVRWWTLPESLADVMTILVIIGCVFFLIRRLTIKEVRYLSSASDYVLLAIVAAPFITGFLSYHQVGNYRIMIILHIVSGIIMLMVIPFTRLIHMLFSVFTRAYMGSEFGNVRHAKDW
jgi:nitrate reductase gamma subunit